MIAHASIAVRNYNKAKKFYQAALKPLGYKLTMDHPEWKAGGYFDGKNTDFWINQPKKFATGHIAFIGKSKAAVQAFHKAALRAGGKDNGAPGFRTDYGPDYYAAFVYDKDGNNVEACYFGARAPGTKAKKRS